MVLEALSCLDLDDGVLNKIRAQLNPPLPTPKPSKRLADLEVKIDKAQHDLARLQNVVVKKQAELQQADERANCKVPPPAPPPTTLPPIPVVVLAEE